MRKFFHALFGTLKLLFAAGMVVFLFALLHAPAFENGEDYTLYFGANSSARSLTTRFPARDKLLSGGVAGESVRYSGDRSHALIEKYRADLLFAEETDGVVSYYLYSPVLGACAEVNGAAVNLQIAVNAEETVVGTPLIFGGF